MSLPQHITKGEGGAIHVDLLTRPTACTVSLYKGSGDAIVEDANATASTINTTLSAAASRGDTSISVASATGISAGSVLWIQDAPEAVTVLKVSGTTIYLLRRLTKDHASGATAEGTRCIYSVSSTYAAACFWDGYAKWVADTVATYTALECTLYPLDRVASAQDLFDRIPALFDVLPEEVDVERLLDLGHIEVLEEIGKKARVRVMPGSSEFIGATVAAALKVHFEPESSEEGTRLYERYSQILMSKIEAVLAVVPQDRNQDGVISADERITFTSVPLVRG